MTVRSDGLESARERMVPQAVEGRSDRRGVVSKIVVDRHAPDAAAQLQAPRTLESQVMDWFQSRAEEQYASVRQAAKEDVRTFVQNSEQDDKAESAAAKHATRFLPPIVRI